MNEGLTERAMVDPPEAAARPRGKPSAAKSWLKAIERTARIEASPHALFADLVEEWAARQPDRPALMSDQETFSYQDLNARINRYARWAISQGIGKGETVCLFLPGQPDYLAAWLGLSRVGAVAALINTKLVGSSLAHCIDVADASHVIVGQYLAGAFREVEPRLKRAPKIWWHGSDAADANIKAALSGLDASPLTSSERRDVTIGDRALLIYTSGTTGLPRPPASATVVF